MFIQILEIMLPAFVIGLLGAGHCLGMCGGISAALSLALPDSLTWRKYRLIAAYNFGRILSYSAMGAVSGLIGFALDVTLLNPAGLPLLRIFSALMLVLMGLYISGWWRILTVLERAGAGIWRRLQPWSKKLLPVKSLNGALLLGLLWGWLPCGLIYSALAYALAQAQPGYSALVMFSFGLGTLPALVVAGASGERLRVLFQRYDIRLVMAMALIIYGVWTFYFALSHSQHTHNHSVPTTDNSEQILPHEPHHHH